MRIEPTKDLTGVKHCHLMPLKIVESDRDGIPVSYECECQCGKCDNEHLIVLARDLAWFQVRCCSKSGPHDLTGMRFFKLTVLENVGCIRGDKLWKCVCDYGTEVVTRQSSLIYGRKQSCNCGRRRDKSGQMFGYLRVIEPVSDKRTSCGSLIYKCECTYNGCGKIIEVPYSISQNCSKETNFNIHTLKKMMGLRDPSSYLTYFLPFYDF